MMRDSHQTVARRNAAAAWGTTLALAVAAALAPPAAAEVHPILERGFEAGRVYQLGDIDHVNLFNGNLIVSLPLGPRYPLGGGFTYGLNLTYNSLIWEFSFGCPGLDGEPVDARVTDPAAVPEGCLQGIPDPKSNAGAGWRVSLGELYGPGGDGSFTEHGGFLFIGPDGSEHEFLPAPGDTGGLETERQYSFDGSYLRLVRNPAAGPAGSVEVQQGDGTAYLFVPAPGTLQGWRLAQIRDGFAVRVMLDDSDPSFTRITDSADREHRIVYDGLGRVQRLELEGPEGRLAVYSFEHGSERVIPGCPHDRPKNPQIPGSGSATVEVPQLDRVLLPDRVSAFEFDYVPANAETSIVCTQKAGRLERIRLPTMGAIEYDYAGYVLPKQRCFEPRPPGSGPGDPIPFNVSGGVARRRMVASDGTTTIGEWFYVPTPLSNFGGIRRIQETECRLRDVAYTDVYEPVDGPGDGTRFKLTRTFFDIHAAGEFGPGAGDEPCQTNTVANGLSYDCYSPDPAAPDRLRSEMVFACSQFPGSSPTAEYRPPDAWPEDKRHLWVPPSCSGPFGESFSSPDDVRGIRELYVRYDHDGVIDPGGPREAVKNPRIPASSRYFHQDGGRSIVTVQSQFDGFGNYRRSDVSANFGPSSSQDPNRSVFVDYNSHLGGLPPKSTPWLLTTFTRREVTEKGVTNTELYDFDTTTGALLSQRSLRALDGAGTPSDRDLRVDFEIDGEGNVVAERYSGGDPGGAIAGSPVQYAIHNDYLAGVLTRREYCEPAESVAGQPCPDDGIVLRTVDADVDEATGLPLSSWDSSGVRTDYDYDLLWRLTQIAPSAVPGQVAEAVTNITYHPATRQTDARVELERRRGGRLTYQEMTYDGLGRLVRERTQRPGGGFSLRRTTYSPQGWPRFVSVLFDPATTSSPKNVVTEYDVFGRPTSIRRPDGSETGYIYNGIRSTLVNVGGIATPNGTGRRSTLFLRNHQGQLVGVRDRDAGGAPVLSTDYFYDPGGRLQRVRQGTQNRVFQYDGTGLLEREEHPELGADLLFRDYDARGNTGRRLLQGGSPFDVRLTYDRAERPTEVREDVTRRLLKEFTYTNLYAGGESAWKNDPRLGNGKPFQAKRHNRGADGRDVVVTETSFYRGVGGRLSRQTLRTGGDGEIPRVHFATSYTFDSLGAVASITYPGCAQAGCGAVDFGTGSVSDIAPDRTVHYTYDRGAVTKVGTSPGSASFADLSYLPNLTLASLARGNGLIDTLVGDPSGMPRPTEIQVGQQVDPDALWATGAYRYDGAGNVRDIGGDVFRYDPVFNRLATATVAHPPRAGQPPAAEQLAYSYDVYGNLLAVSGSTSRAFSVDALTNRLTGPGIAYDQAGNLTAHGGWVYSYDSFNMATRSEHPARGLAREYLYTADDERLASLIGDGTRELWTLRGLDHGVLRDFEHLSTGWAWLEDSVHRDGLLLATVDRDGTANGRVEHHHLDHLGTTRLITGPTGAIVAEKKYLPYGEELDPIADGERLEFTGHERDDLDPGGAQEGDLDYMHARYYSPELGRFTSIDPIGGNAYSSQSWNRYAYVLGNPVRYGDPMGLQAECVRTQDEDIPVECDETIDVVDEESEEEKRQGTSPPATISRDISLPGGGLNTRSALPSEYHGLSFHEAVSLAVSRGEGGSCDEVCQTLYLASRPDPIFSAIVGAWDIAAGVGFGGGPTIYRGAAVAVRTTLARQVAVGSLRETAVMARQGAYALIVPANRYTAAHQGGFYVGMAARGVSGRSISVTKTLGPIAKKEIAVYNWFRALRSGPSGF